MSNKIRLNKYKKRLFALAKHPFFWILTIFGNSIVFFGSLLLYYFEKDQSSPLEYIDCLLWSMGTVTTIGYGNYTPLTFPGKITLLLLMAGGTLFVWSYMGFLVTGLIAPELSSLEKDVHEVEKDVLEVEKELHDLKTKS
jgi:voltage-gated potassium channel